MTRERDYRAEYLQRIRRQTVQGLSRRQARGHPGRDEDYVSRHFDERRINDRLESIRREAQRTGEPIATIAGRRHVAPERVMRYLHQQGVLQRRGGRYDINDQRAREIQIYSHGHATTITVPTYKEAELIGTYMDAVDDFLTSNDPRYLRPFVGQSVADSNGKKHVFETDPNTLYRLNEMGYPAFEQVYKILN